MARVARLALVLVVATVLETTVFSRLRLFGVAPDVGLVVAVGVAAREGPVAGATTGFAAGLLLDCFLSTPLGLSALAWALAGYLVGVAQEGVVRASPRAGAAPVVGGFGVLVGGLLFAGLAVLAGQEHVMAARTLGVVVLAALYGALLSPLVFPVARWAARSREAVAPRRWAL